eukprot:gb/GEZN01012792.1/.p1 GENE.gb/GEZN01012792.1/~~gb/GEZN01012792.1/.p1  ORF type:complete len:268 (-),score=76.37 gb/GEZN01012792.1/:251-1027(-)
MTDEWHDAFPAADSTEDLPAAETPPSTEEEWHEAEDFPPEVEESHFQEQEYRAQDIQDLQEEEKYEESAVTIEEVIEKDSKKANNAKKRGNDFFSEKLYDNAINEYKQAILLCPAEDHDDRSIFFGNLAAAYLMQEKWKEAEAACNDALEIKPDYVKVLRRRARAAEELQDLEQALTDHKRLSELDANDKEAKKNVARLTPLVEAKREKMKEEMIGKMKDLGNTILGKFGMSLNNFAAVQDPKTGSYSISYNPPGGNK